MEQCVTDERATLDLRRMRITHQKEIEMRELSVSEMSFVSGAGGECSGNVIVGIADSSNFGNDVIAIYEGLIAATSHIIERVANSF
jgi:hypothetical protein